MMDTLVSTSGWVGTPVDFKVSRHGVSIANFRLASTPRFVRNGQWVDGQTTWLPVTCYRGLAEHVHESIAKGEPVIVVGKLRTTTWFNAQGEERERAVLEAQTVGHDLTRGTATFRKRERRQRAEVEDSELAEMISIQDGEVDTEFGSDGPREDVPEVDDDELGALMDDAEKREPVKVSG